MSMRMLVMAAAVLAIGAGGCAREVVYGSGSSSGSPGVVVSGTGGEGGGAYEVDPLTAAWNRLLACHQPTPCDEFDAYAFEKYGTGGATKACVMNVLGVSGEAQLRAFTYDEAQQKKPEWNLFVFPDRSAVVWRSYWGDVSNETHVSVCTLKDEAWFKGCNDAACVDPSSWFTICADADLASIACH